MIDSLWFHHAKARLGLLIAVFAAHGLQAEVILDGSLGRQGAIPLDLQKTYSIDSSMGQKLGSNLFHSFSRFNLESGTIAHFTDSQQSLIDHVIARVTGGSQSELNGTLKSSIPQADFYLINPAGILFGPDAKLDLPGAFFVSTANRLIFQDGKHFEASPVAGEVLTSASPQAFGFLNAPLGRITIDGSHLDQRGQSLHLIGGDINIDNAEITSADGQIMLSSVASAGPIAIDHTVASRFARWGKIDITHSSLDSSGGNNNRLWIEAGDLSVSAASDLFADNKSALPQIPLNSVLIHGSMTLDNSKLTSDSYQQGDSSGLLVKVGKELNLLNGGIIQTAAYDAGNAGKINVSAEKLLLQGEGQQDDWGPSRIMSVAASGTGNANEVAINASRAVTLNDGALIGSNTLTDGHGGRLAITTGDLTVGQGSIISGETWGNGKGSDVMVHARNILLDGQGQAVDAAFTGIFVTAEIDSLGGTGNLSVLADQTLQVINGAKISGTNFNAGHRGDVFVSADQILLDGMRSGIPTGIVVSAEKGSSSMPGRLDVVANDSLQIRHGAKINGATWGSGQGDDVRVTANHLLIDGADTRFHTGIYASAMSGSTGDAGNVEVSSRQDVTLAHGAEISAFTQGEGKGGNVTVTAADVTLQGHSKIEALSSTEAIAGSVSIKTTTSTGTVNLLGGSQVNVASVYGDAGNVTIVTPRWLYLLNSAITTSANAGEGNGGNIVIDPSFVILNESAIIANAVRGNGGNIAIAADFFLPSIGSQVSASSQFGLQGVVSIQSQYSNLASSIAVLPGNLLDVSNRFWDDCGKVANTAGVSTFVLSGRGGLPMAPDNFVGQGLQAGDCMQARGSEQSPQDLVLNNFRISLPRPAGEGRGEGYKKGSYLAPDLRLGSK